MMFIIALLLACGMAHAQSYDRIRVRPFDRTFRVDFYPEDDDRPYRVVFYDDGVKSKYRFNDDGLVRAIRVEDEDFSVIYTSRNELKRVEERDRRRMLAVEDENEEENEQPVQHRRLHTCAECTATWVLMCGPGAPDIFPIQSDLYGSGAHIIITPTLTPSVCHQDALEVQSLWKQMCTLPSKPPFRGAHVLSKPLLTCFCHVTSPWGRL